MTALKITKIAFPGLGIDEFSINSVAFQLGNIKVAWYGIILTLGIVFAIAYVWYRKSYADLTTDDLIDFALFVVPSGILGGRLYYVLTSLDKYDSIGEAFAIWHGGLAIYGAIGGGALAVIICCKVKKKNFLAMADCTCPGVLIGQILGRWGNFVNGEAHGGITDLPWRMSINGTCYHPTFLYESLWNLIGFLLINLFFKKKQYNGQIFFMCFAWYGLGRAFIEGLRTDSLYIFGTIRISQLVGVICFVVFGGLLLYNFIKRKVESKNEHNS